MGIVAKAIRKSNKGLAKLRSLDLEDREKADEPLTVLLPISQPEKPRQASGGPSPSLPATLENPASGQVLPTTRFDPEARISPTAEAPEQPAASLDVAAKLRPVQGTLKPADESTIKALPNAGRLKSDLVSLTNPEGLEAELFKVLRT